MYLWVYCCLFVFMHMPALWILGSGLWSFHTFKEGNTTSTLYCKQCRNQTKVIYTPRSSGNHSVISNKHFILSLLVETSNSNESDFIDLTETDDEVDNADHPLSATPHAALACSPSFASIVSAGSVRTVSSQDRDSPIVISIDSPPRRTINSPDSFYGLEYNPAVVGGMSMTLPKPPPAHSKIPVSSYASSLNPNYPSTAASPHLRNMMYNQGVLPEFDYSSVLPLNSMRQPAHSNSQSKSHLSMFP